MALNHSPELYLLIAGHVPGGPQGHNLNKLGRGPFGDATYQISRL